MRPSRPYRELMPLLFLLAWASAHAGAGDHEGENKPPFKLSLSHYSASDLEANDVNLRIKHEDQSAWIANYHDSTHFAQTRIGYEREDDWDFFRLTSSIQAATHGFLGMALTSEIGGRLHAILGYGRTNLKPYDNINFDPNDNVQWGAGYDFDEGNDISLYRVRDNRVVPGQQIDHLMLHVTNRAGNKASYDLFTKSGPRDATGQSIAATGGAFSYDWPRYFLRVAYDPKVNFTQSYMTRVTLGFYF